MKKDRKVFINNKYYPHLRRFAWVALVCTVVMALVIFISSLLSASASSKITLWIQSIIKGVSPEADVEKGEASGLAVDLELFEGEDFYTDSKIKVVATAQPKGSYLGEIVIESKNEDIAKVENGFVVLGKFGKTSLTITAKENPLLKKSISVTSLGQNPQTITSLEVAQESLTLTQGESAEIILNGGYFNPSLAEIEFSHPDVLTLYGDTLFAENEGEVTVTFKVGEFSAQQTYTVLPNLTPLPPVVITAKSDLEFCVDDTITLSDLIDGDEVIVDSCRIEFVKGNADSLYIYPSMNKATATAEGEVRIKIISNIDESVFVEIPLEITPKKSTAFILKGESFVSYYGDAYTYVLQTEWGDALSSDEVTWSVSGNARISKSGKLTPLGLGKIKITATVVYDDLTYTVHKTVTVRLYNDFYGFVRKIAGHFSMFAILGFGLAGVCFLLTKPKWLSPLYALSLGAIAAGISEMFQLPIFSEGRVASGVDVLVDFMGVCLGVALAFVVLGIWFLIDYLISGGKCIKTMSKMSIFSLLPMSKQKMKEGENTSKDKKEIPEKSEEIKNNEEENIEE